MNKSVNKDITLASNKQKHNKQITLIAIYHKVMPAIHRDQTRGIYNANRLVGIIIIYRKRDRRK